MGMPVRALLSPCQPRYYITPQTQTHPERPTSPNPSLQPANPFKPPKPSPSPAFSQNPHPRPGASLASDNIGYVHQAPRHPPAPGETERGKSHALPSLRNRDVSRPRDMHPLERLLSPCPSPRDPPLGAAAARLTRWPQPGGEGAAYSSVNRMAIPDNVM